MSNMDGNSTLNLAPPDPNTILQSDVTIIAGLLVLLTISGILKEHFKTEQQVWKLLRWLVGSTTTLFSFSAMVIVAGYDQSVIQTAMIFSRWFFIGGIAVIVGSIIVLMWYLKIKNPEEVC